MANIIQRYCGKFGEFVAKRHLLADGHKLIISNWKVRAGEIDIISIDGTELVFTEVKARFAKDYYGFDPADAVDWRKIEKIKTLTGQYLETNGRKLKQWKISRIRYDVIGVRIISLLRYEIEHRREAFY